MSRKLRLNLDEAVTLLLYVDFKRSGLIVNAEITNKVKKIVEKYNITDIEKVCDAILRGYTLCALDE